jgi:RHS repeat-associated protein
MGGVNEHPFFYVYGLGLIGEETGSQYTSYHFDLRGSTVALTNSTAQVTERFQYSPYGVLLSGDVKKTPFLFNGMYGVMTDSNGLYYMRARFYSPEMRRFVNQDILLGFVEDGQSLNRYAYVIINWGQSQINFSAPNYFVIW